MSDNRPQFSSEQFRKFRQEYDFKHFTTSPYYATVRRNRRHLRTVNSPRRVHDGQELDVNMESRAEGPVAGSKHPEPEELPQIETPGSVTSAQ